MNAIVPRPCAAAAPSELIARHDGRAPRYTSYPTAAQFTSDVDAEVHQQWLAALPTDEGVSLYLHIPFCERLCWYCGCNTRAVTRRETISGYVDLLETELALAESVLPGKLRAKSIHFGGGTPNMLSPDDLTQLFGVLRHVFDVTPGAQIAAELDPAVLTREWVQAAAFHGLTRASLGVQDLSPEVQAAVNRIESFEVIENAVGWLREANVGSINLDLMYGLPRQTTDSVINTLDQVLSLRPERIALFGYAHVPWMKSHQRLIDEGALPGSEERFVQSEAAAAYLFAAGYVRIGLDHYALPEDGLAVAQAEGRLRRNFQGYTDDPAHTVLGFGASAISQLPQGFVQNLTTERDWRTAVSAGHLPTARGVELTDEDRFRGDIIGQLMCRFRVDLDAVCADHGRSRDELAFALSHLTPLEADGLAELSGSILTVTENGRPFVRTVCALFDTHLDRAAQRHARVV
ncbi:oxygen-independent coproporphyrinogen III oxidase [Caulobacter segnis]|uniref:oxygen-independent coproporphyrinogen III oxidase n=1 Tax=Caulobacter segnis TaxID=88688 RepID=UPI00241020FE|nr:oxygen-independent coproporphyrinogen III oxidase [Caulobacter segnis]MDG2520255.1 oxygen-independent coproporphyrinogen III oxidase [Caulobacter segnis]